jgi:SAM-dependent methyltransferase
LTKKKHLNSFPENSNPVDYYENHGQTYIDNNQNPADFIDEFLGSLRSAGSILDLGCGHGINANYMQSKGFQVFGIDLSKKMIANAQKAYPHIEFQIGDMAALPFPSDSFDGILASYSLIHLTKDMIRPVLKKLYEILKSGGAVYISVQSGNSEQGLFTHPLTPSERLFLNVFSKQEIFDLLSEHGFEIVTYQEKQPLGKVFKFVKLFILAKKPSVA